MLTRIIQSRTFEKKFFWLRKSIPFLSRRYNEFYGINIITHSNIQSESMQIALKTAQNSLQTLQSACHNSNNINNTIPKKLWLYWNASIESAPEVVQVSVASWKSLNPDYEITLLNDDNLNSILGFDFNAVFKLSTVNISYAHKADLLRLYLLAVHGGVWVDTTTFCLQPLSSWVDSETKKSGFFTFRHKNNKTRPIEIWFIAVNKGSLIITYTLKLFIDHLFKPRKHSLMLSNRIKKIGKHDFESNHFFSDVVVQAESKGFMPYFSVGYFLNEALNQPNTVNIWHELTNRTNKCVVNNDPIYLFKQAYVSKQTYKKTYQESSLFKERVAYIKEKS